MSEPPPDWAVEVPSTGLVHQPGALALRGGERTRPFTGQQLQQIGGEFNEQFLANVVRGLNGAYVPGPHGSAMSQLQSWVEYIPIVGDIWEVFTGVPDSNPYDVGSLINSLLRIFRPVPRVIAGVVGDMETNLLIAPDFRSAGTIEDSTIWTWTDAVGYDSLGAVQVVAGGFLTELLSNEIPVTGGQTMLNMTVRVKWSGLTYTGTDPIALGITRYLDRTEIASEDLASIESPAASSDWIELYKDRYLIPTDCDEVRFRLKIGDNATAGTIYFDDASVRPHGMGLFDRIVMGLENLDEPGYNWVDLLLSMFNQFLTTSDHATRLTYLESLQSAGNKINDEFNREATDLGANWDQDYYGTGAGTWETNGNMAFWHDSGFGNRNVICRWIGSTPVTQTDNQRIIAVLGAKGQSGYLPSIIGPLYICGSYIELYGRMDTGGTNWIRVRFKSTGYVYIDRSLSGTVTNLVTVDPYNWLTNPDGPKAPGAGATIELVCGTSAGPRYFEAWIDGVRVAQANDATSNYGASYRGYGHGAAAEGSILVLGQATPASLNAWAAIDNTV